MTTPRTLACRPGCGACCIAPSISTPIPGLGAEQARPKAAGERCWQLDEELRCRLFGRPERPAVCGSLAPSHELCGPSPEAALVWIAQLERLTHPAAP